MDNTEADRRSRRSHWLRRLREAGLWKFAPWVVLGLALTAAGVIYVYLTHRLWFFQDDWDFLLTRGNVPGHSLGLLEPHGDHWSTGPILIYRGLFETFGLNTYTPWAVTTVVIHLFVALMSAVVVRRLGAGPWVSVSLGIGVAYLGAGAGIFTVDNAMNHSGSLLLGLAALALLARNAVRIEDWRIAAIWGCLVASLAFSGTGVVVVALVVFFVLFDRGLRDAILVLSAPLAIYLLWFIQYGRGGAAGILEPATLYLEVPRFVLRGLSNAVAQTFLLGAGGTVGLVVLAGVALLPPTPAPRLRRLAAAGLLAGVLQFVLIGISRIGFGHEVVDASRYIYITMVLLIGMVTSAVLRVLPHFAPRKRVVAAGAVALLLTGYMINGVDLARAYARGQIPITTIWRDRMLGVIEAHDDGQRFITTETEDWLNSDLDPWLVVDPAIRNVMPQESSTPVGRLDAEAIFMVGVGEEEFGLWNKSVVSFAGAEFTSPRIGGCRSFRVPVAGAVIRVSSRNGTEVGIRGPMESVKTQLERAGIQSNIVRTWETTGGVAHIATSAREADLLITLDSAGDYTMCYG